MMISFKCKCGNCDPTRTKEYDGAIGYAAVVCRTCGRFADHNGWHDAEDWSKQFIVPHKDLKLAGAWDLDWPDLRKAGFGREAMGFEQHATIFKIDGVAAVATSWLDGSLAGFSVAKAFRGRGIGTQFIRELIKEEGGVLRVADANEKMLKLLGNIGRVSEPDGTGTVTVIQGDIMENKKEVVIWNEHLLQNTATAPRDKAWYMEVMAKATIELRKASDLTIGEKRGVAEELSQPGAAGVIRHWSKSDTAIKDLIYAGVCMVNGGDPFLHEKFTRRDWCPEVPKEYQIMNVHLMKEVDGLPDLTKKYQDAQKDLSNLICYGQLTYSDKEKIVLHLNSAAGAELIARHHEQPEVTIYASLCAADNGTTASLSKYQLDSYVFEAAAEIGADVVAHNAAKSRSMEM